MHHRNRIGLTTLAALGLAVTGCNDSGGGGGASNTGGISFSGTIGTSYQTAYAPGFGERMLAWLVGERAVAAVDIATVTHVWAVPVFTDQTGSSWTDFGDDIVVKATVNSDRSFEMNLDPGQDWMLLLMDMDQPHRKDQIVGYISVEDVNRNLGLLLMPVTDLADNETSVDLGEVDNGGSGDEAASDTVDLSNLQPRTTLELSQLEELASVDDLYKGIKNHYVNYDEATGHFYLPDVTFSWQLPSAPLDNDGGAEPNTAVDLSPASDAYRGFSFFVQTNVTMPDGACPAVGDPSYTNTDYTNDAYPAVEIFPPADAGLSHSGITGRAYDATTPLAGDAVGSMDFGYDVYGDNTCMDDDFSLAGPASTDPGPYFGGPWGENYLQTADGAMPGGEWRVDIDGESVAWFFLDTVDPFNADGEVAVYVPAPQLTLNASNEMTAIDVAWYRYDITNSTYVEVTDLTTLAELTSNQILVLTDHDGNDGDTSTRAEVIIEAGDAGVITGLDTTELTYDDNGTLWATELDNAPTDASSNDENTLMLDSLSINFRMGDVYYDFAYRYANNPSNIP